MVNTQAKSVPEEYIYLIIFREFCNCENCEFIYSSIILSIMCQLFDNNSKIGK